MAEGWGYMQSDGPHTWFKSFPVVAGTRQSPVNIVSKESIHDASLATNPITISYRAETNMVVKNSGHSIQADASQESVIFGGPLSGKYRLQQFHLHWGTTDDVGSEHTINGTSCSGELHLVHYNCEKYKTFTEALDKADGLSVFGVMVTIGKEHAGFKHITDLICNIRQKGQSTRLSIPFNPTCLLPDDTSSYWTYMGSLTTPPLYESVTWIVFSKQIHISREQMDLLRSMRNKEHGGEPIGNNYRPPLPLGDRKIRCSFKKRANKCLNAPELSGASYLVVGAAVVVAAAVVTGFLNHMKVF
ncbi:hypothetical protein CHS0354_038560 [Potamilus streckersoni]|uniref:Alpha-carbonic anhydrase domain-containing protein n=1 Tax=Potamilus streckersoni TaxID=2493646 RepID=A0AAE0RRM3_9BIVA|nr:hypothetical protein CHS0354_038560 [Potamilus streckersoni]